MRAGCPPSKGLVLASHHPLPSAFINKVIQESRFFLWYMQAAFWEDWAFYLQIGWGEEKARRGKRKEGIKTTLPSFDSHCKWKFCRPLKITVVLEILCWRPYSEQQTGVLVSVKEMKASVWCELVSFKNIKAQILIKSSGTLKQQDFQQWKQPSSRHVQIFFFLRWCLEKQASCNGFFLSYFYL